MRVFGQTENVELAAALGVCGFRLWTEPMLDERSGVVRQAIRYSTTAESGMDAHELIKGLRSGALEEVDPEHPLLAALWALHNGAMLGALDWRGEKRRLVKVAKAARCFYDDEVSGSLESPGGRDLMRTADRAVAAALGVCGVPVVEVEPGSPCRFVLWAKGMTLLDRSGKAVVMDAVDLVTRMRDGRLVREEPWHPFLIGVQACRAREGLREMFQAGTRLVALRPPGTGRKAVVREDASDGELERVSRFLRC